MIGFLTGGIGRWFVLAAALYMGYLYVQAEHYKHEYEAEEAVYAKFVAETKAVGLQAIADNKQKELDNAKRLAAANDARDAATACLRDDKCAGRRSVSANQPASFGNGQVCADASAVDAAFQRYTDRLNAILPRIDGLATQGTEANIDAASLIQAWPK
jgi:hypothetical protein